jgi:hypothetical protein
VKDFHNHVIFATNKVIAEKPEVVRGFLAGWFETIASMKANKDETVRLIAPIMHQSPEIANKAYDAHFFRYRALRAQGCCGVKSLFRADESASDRAGYEQALYREIPAGSFVIRAV